MTTIELWEDNAGGLALIERDAQSGVVLRGWIGLEGVQGGCLAEDVQAIRADDIGQWTVDTLPDDWDEDGVLIAVDNGEGVHVVGFAGRAGEAYLRVGGKDT